MNYNLKEISHFDFFEILEKYVKNIEVLLESENAILTEFIEKSNSLIQKVETHISQYIVPSPDIILDLLDKEYNSIFDNKYSRYSFDKLPEIKKEIERLERFRKSLKLLIGYLSITETLFDGNNVVQIETISDKNDFILSKLNILFGDDMYSIYRILEFNNIKYRDKESREIAEDLYRRGYVILKDRYGDSDKVKISVKGASFIERKHKRNKNNKTKSELDKKIDNIIEHLTKLGHGQEIIFNEIDELRELQYNLPKKTWAQLLKGKLIDLALSKVISAETASSVYEYLVNNNFQLLK
jgi:predicted transcriptional regulator